MRKTRLFRTLKALIGVLLINAVFYAFYRIAAIRWQWSEAVFAVGCVFLSLVVLVLCTGATRGLHTRK